VSDAWRWTQRRWEKSAGGTDLALPSPAFGIGWVAMAAAVAGRDRWCHREIRFANLTEAREAINDATFLDTYFEV